MPTLITPPNPNIAQTTKFSLTFQRNPNLVFWCQKVNIPGLSLSSISQPTPLVNLKVPGHKLLFKELNVKFIVDEDWRSWFEIFAWMIGLGFPESPQQYKNMLAQFAEDGGSRSDATVTMYSNNNNPNRRIIYRDVFPVDISDIDLDTEQDADHIVTATASFQYNYYEFRTA